MTASDVVIVGGGLAGMAAAESLSRHFPDLRVTLLESKRRLGGRAGSYVDPESGQEVDYCQHAAMGCCSNLLDLIDHCDLQAYFRRFDELTFLHPDHPPSRFAANRWLPAPLHLLGAINAQRYLTARQKREIKRGLWKLMRTPTASLGNVLASTWLSSAGQSAETIRSFWDVILVSALGEQTDQVAMSAARKVMIDGFAIARGASDVLVPTQTLGEIFGRLLADALATRGVEIRTGQSVKEITSTGQVLTSAEKLESGFVICAVPWHKIDKLFRSWPEADKSRLPDLESISRIPGSPITGLHLWFDRPITDRDHAVLVGTVAQWLFRDPVPAQPKGKAQPSGKAQPKGASQPNQTGAKRENESSYYYQVVISASADATAMPKQALVDLVLSELRTAFPNSAEAKLTHFRLVTDPKSVFSIRPQVDTIRPPSRTDFPWLALAGDWTQTDWPATMEGAVISGRVAAGLAAEHLMKKDSVSPAANCDVKNQDFGQTGGSRKFPSMVLGGLAAGPLARLLIRR